MSTWTSKTGRRFLAGALCTALAATAVAGEAPAPRKVSVDGRAITVTGPAGYCVDLSSSRDRADGAFVVLGRCAALGGGAAEASAVLTASVAPGPASPVLQDSGAAPLAAFFQTEAGRAALSRSGNSRTVRIEEMRASGDVLYLHIADSANGTAADLGHDYWRAVLPLRGRLVTLSALSPDARPVPAGQQKATLETFVAGMQAANR